MIPGPYFSGHPCVGALRIGREAAHFHIGTGPEGTACGEAVNGFKDIRFPSAVWTREDRQPLRERERGGAIVAEVGEGKRAEIHGASF